MRNFRKYLAVESVQLSSKGLRFLRTADIEDVRYWLWEFDDDGEPAYAYVESYLGSGTLGTQPKHGLTPEQFLVLEYLRNQYQIKIY